ncbi:MAG: SxtJ family membrane protein [Burkholderiaceae bacterium]
MNQTSNPPELPSDRKFGLFFAAMGSGFASYGVFADWPGAATLALALSAGVFLAFSWLAPAMLRPLNRAWYALGQLLGLVVSPIVLGVIFFVIVTPIAVVTRLAGRDVLSRRRDPTADSYWVARQQRAADPNPFKNQF